jgi:hypothetical protein
MCHTTAPGLAACDVPDPQHLLCVERGTRDHCERLCGLPQWQLQQYAEYMLWLSRIGIQLGKQPEPRFRRIPDDLSGLSLGEFLGAINV